MNVEKIQKLSQQHKLLKSFRKTCGAACVELQVRDLTMSEQFRGVLDSDTTGSIICDLRGILLDRISVIEIEIRKATSNG